MLPPSHDVTIPIAMRRTFLLILTPVITTFLKRVGLEIRVSYQDRRVCREKDTERIRTIFLLSIIAVRRESKRVGPEVAFGGNSLIGSLMRGRRRTAEDVIL